MKETQLWIEELKSCVVARAVRVNWGSGEGFEVVIDTQEHDDITDSVVDGVWGPAPHYRIMPSFLSPTSRVLDLGAHIGTFALYSAHLGHAVVSIEASPRNARLLEESIRVNGFESARVFCRAVGDHEGTVQFIIAGPFGHVAEPSWMHETISVPLTTVPRILEEIGWDGVDLIKMDIEGSEVAAIRGMRELLETAGAPLLLFESNSHTLNMFDESPQSLLCAVADLGYSLYLVLEGRLVQTDPNHVQPECVADYLASKRPLQSRDLWAVESPRTHEELVAELLVSADLPHEHYRAHVGRSLRNVGPEISTCPVVRDVLARLAEDEHPDVRASVSWWRRG